MKNQAYFQTYTSISYFHRFCETGSKDNETGFKYYETGEHLSLAISPKLYDVLFELYTNSLKTNIKSKLFTLIYWLFCLKGVFVKRYSFGGLLVPSCN